MKITDIQPQKKNKNRFSIYIDGKYYFSLDFNTFKNWDFHIGDEITEGDIEKLKRKDEFWKAKDYCLNLFSYGEKTENEVIKRLKKKGYSKWIIYEVIKYLKEYELINDENFARNWIASMIKIKPMGKFRAEYELKKRGIKPDLAKSMCKELISYETEMELAFRAAKKKYETLKSYNEHEQKKKLLNFLKNRGFNFEIIMNVIKEYFGEEIF